MKTPTCQAHSAPQTDTCHLDQRPVTASYPGVPASPSSADNFFDALNISGYNYSPQVKS